MRKLLPVYGNPCTEMVGLGWTWLPLLALLLAQTPASFRYQLVKAVLQQLNDSSSQFDAWTQQLSEQLSSEQQQRLAWNVHFLESPPDESGLQLRELQKRLNPNNPLKLWLWISFYWQLRRSHRLESDETLLPHFALTLRQLQADQRQHSSRAQLQNMLLSLPRYLGEWVKSRCLCLKHDRDQLYALPNGVLQLGANSNCSMWQVELLESSQYWLRLQNACELHATWFVNMLQHKDSGTYMLLNAPGPNSSTYCIQNGTGYLVLEKEQVERVESDRLRDDCHWQLNDCTQLPTFLKRHYRP